MGEPKQMMSDPEADSEQEVSHELDSCLQLPAPSALAVQQRRLQTYVGSSLSRLPPSCAAQQVVCP